MCDVRSAAPGDRWLAAQISSVRLYSKLIGNMTDIWDYSLSGARGRAEVRELEDHRQGNT